MCGFCLELPTCPGQASHARAPVHDEPEAPTPGDAAHSIVPFMGQGVNIGFEDCQFLFDTLKKCSNNFEQSFQKFSDYRQPEGVAASKLSERNYKELVDADPLIKAVMPTLRQLFPSLIPPNAITMVNFFDHSYSEVLRKINRRRFF